MSRGDMSKEEDREEQEAIEEQRAMEAEGKECMEDID